MTTPPAPRALALDAAAVALNAGQYWLPAEAQAAVVDAVAAVYEADLAARLDLILADADHHNAGAAQSAEKYPDVPELPAAHSGMAAGVYIAAAHVARGNPGLAARLKQRIDQVSVSLGGDKISLRKHDVDLANAQASRDRWRRDYAELAERHKRVLAELDALHQGEEPCPEHVRSTPAQWLWQWNRATPEQRLDMASRILAAFDTAEACFLQAHEARAADGRADRDTLGRVRTELERWARNTVMPQTARALDDIRRALEPPKETPDV